MFAWGVEGRGVQEVALAALRVWVDVQAVPGVGVVVVAGADAGQPRQPRWEWSHSQARIMKGVAFFEGPLLVVRGEGVRTP